MSLNCGQVDKQRNREREGGERAGFELGTGVEKGKRLAAKVLSGR